MIHLLSVQRHAPQGFHVGLGIDTCRFQTGMPQDLSNGWKRRTLLKKPSRQSVAKGMYPSLLWTPKGDPRQSAPIRDDVVQVVAVHERIKRRIHFEEDLSVRRFGTTRLQVVDQGLTNLLGQRQAQRH